MAQSKILFYLLVCVTIMQTSRSFKWKKNNLKCLAFNNARDSILIGAIISFYLVFTILTLSQGWANNTFFTLPSEQVSGTISATMLLSPIS